MTTLTITKPDDWHIHLRDNEFLNTTVAHAAQRFERVVVMPNLKPPVRTAIEAENYRRRILSHLPGDTPFLPLMTLYLTDVTTPEVIVDAKKKGIIGCKLYPAGSTTHADSGVTNIEKLYKTIETMAEVDLPLLIHGEVTDAAVDIFDREARFIDDILSQLTTRFKSLRIVLEHITTEEAAQFVSSGPPTLAATITPHHLLLNRNDIFVGGIKPHHYCLPIIKRRRHQEALIKAATSGQPCFFLGTDSAPHAKELKEAACGCAGIYSAHGAIELYCEAFEEAQALHKLENFASVYGADFYKLPRNQSKISLIKEDWQVPHFYQYGNSKLIPFRAGEIIHWKLKTNHD